MFEPQKCAKKSKKNPTNQLLHVTAVGSYVSLQNNPSVDFIEPLKSFGLYITNNSSSSHKNLISHSINDDASGGLVTCADSRGVSESEESKDDSSVHPGN